MSKTPSTAASQRDWLTLSEASEFLRLHRQTVRKLIRAGKLEAWQLFPGTRSPYRISKASLERLGKE